MRLAGNMRASKPDVFQSRTGVAYHVNHLFRFFEAVICATGMPKHNTNLYDSGSSNVFSYVICRQID